MLRAAAVLALLVVGMLPYGHEASAATFQVAMKGYAFSPASLSVPAGSTVTWTNYDTAPHDVKTTSGPLAIHSPMLNKGESWSFTFTTAGAYGYVCTVHPDMTAGITVRAAAPAPTPAAPTRHEHTQPSTSQQQQHSTMPGMTTGRSPRRPVRLVALTHGVPGRRTADGAVAAGLAGGAAGRDPGGRVHGPAAGSAAGPGRSGRGGRGAVPAPGGVAGGRERSAWR